MTTQQPTSRWKLFAFVIIAALPGTYFFATFYPWLALVCGIALLACGAAYAACPDQWGASSGLWPGGPIPEARTTHMPTHDVTVEIPKKSIQAKDIQFGVKLDGTMLGTLLVSKGNIEWVPANNKVRKSRLTWERFAEMMQSQGRNTRMRRKPMMNNT